MSVALRFVRGLEGRARTRMAWPRALNAAAIAEPRKPLAPVTRMVEGGAEWNALHVARPADPRSCETTPCPLSRSMGNPYQTAQRVSPPAGFPPQSLKSSPTIIQVLVHASQGNVLSPRPGQARQVR